MASRPCFDESPNRRIVGLAAGFCVLLFAWIAGCDSSPSEPPPPIQPPPLTVSILISESSVAFDSVTVGQEKFRDITITNAPGSSGTLTGTVGINGSGFSIVSSGGSFSLSPGQSRAVTVRFAPSAAASYSGAVLISHNDTDSGTSISVPLTGTGTPAISISGPSSGMSLKTPVGGTSTMPLRYTSFTNSGTYGTLTGTTTITGPGFSIASGGGPFSLLPGESRQVKVQFSAAVAGSFLGILEIEHNATNRASPIRFEMRVTVYVPGDYVLTVNGDGSGDGTVMGSFGSINCSVSSGTTTGRCNQGYSPGTKVTLTAIAASGHSFSGWSGACSGSESTCTVTMSGEPLSVTASFAAPTPTSYLLVVVMAGTGTGTVTSSPAGLNCSISNGATSGSCSASYAPGTNVTLTAAPTNGHSFDGWSGACSGSGTCSVSMTEARSAIATFTEPRLFWLVAAPISGSHDGTVTSSPPGIDCTLVPAGLKGECTARFPNGTIVTLTALPASGNSFGGWSGDCSGTGGCTVSMTQDRDVRAFFVQGGPSCSYSISPTSRQHGVNGGSETVSVTTQSGCAPWPTTKSNETWVTITSKIVTDGGGTVNYSVDANANASRTGTLTIAGQRFTVNQDGAANPPCTFEISPTQLILLGTEGARGTSAKTVNVITQPSCPWIVQNVPFWITIISATSGTGSGTVWYTVDSNFNQWTAADRFATLTIEGNGFYVAQEGIRTGNPQYEVLNHDSEDQWAFFRYGNWCGEGWIGGVNGGSVESHVYPIDSLDLACRFHDLGWALTDDYWRPIYDVTSAFYKPSVCLLWYDDRKAQNAALVQRVEDLPDLITTETPDTWGYEPRVFGGHPLTREERVGILRGREAVAWLFGSPAALAIAARIWVTIPSDCKGLISPTS